MQKGEVEDPDGRRPAVGDGNIGVSGLHRTPQALPAQVQGGACLVMSMFG
jgi:hypothetical protein